MKRNESRRACLLKQKKGGGGGGVSSTSHSAPYLLPVTLALVLLLGLLLIVTPSNIGVDSAATTSTTTFPNPNQSHKKLRVDYTAQESLHTPDLFVNRIEDDSKAVLTDSPILLTNDKGSGLIKEQQMPLSGKGTRGGGGGEGGGGGRGGGEQEEMKVKEKEKEKEKEGHPDMVVAQALAPSNGSPLRKVTIIILL